MHRLFSSFGCIVIAAALLGFPFSGCAPRASVEPEETEGGQRLFKRALLDEELSRLVKEEFQVPPGAEAHYQFLRGEIAFSEGDFEEALSHYEAAAAVEEGSAALLRRRLAELYIREGDLESALVQVDRALEDAPKNPELLQIKAGVLSALKRTEEAVECYRLLLAESEEPSEDIYVLLATLLAQQSKLDDATRTLEELTKLRPDSVFAVYYLAKIYEGRGLKDEAVGAYKRALELNPGAEAVRLDYARCLGSMKQYPEALELAREVVKSNPKNLTARKLTAQLLLLQNKLEAAQKEFEALGDLEEDSTTTKFKIAAIKFERGDVEGAIIDLNLLLAAHPDYSAARYYLATAYVRQNRVEEAVKELGKILPTAPNYVEARLHQAYLLQQTKKLDEAVRILDEALENKDGDVRLLMFAAAVQREVGNIKAAIELVERAIEIEPENDNFFFNLGVYYDEIKDKQKSISTMERAIELNPENANALNYLGYTLVEAEVRLDEAVVMIRKAIEIEPENGYFIDSLGWAFYKQGKFEEALIELERAADLVPDDAVILEHLALVRVKTGDTASALDVARRALQVAPESDDDEVEGRLQTLITELESKVAQDTPVLRAPVAP